MYWEMAGDVFVWVCIVLFIGAAAALVVFLTSLSMEASIVLLLGSAIWFRLGRLPNQWNG